MSHKRTSKVWGFYSLTKEGDEFKSKCNMCNHSFEIGRSTSSYGTSSLWHHLNKCHSSESSVQPVLREHEEAQLKRKSNSAFESTSDSKVIESSSETFLNTLVKIVAQGFLPRRFVASPELRQLLLAYSASKMNLSAVNEKSISEKITEFAQLFKNRMSSILRAENIYPVHILIDSWTNCTSVKITNVLLSCKTEVYYWDSYETISEPYSSDLLFTKLSTYIEGLLNDGIRVASICGDNVSVNLACFKRLRERYFVIYLEILFPLP